MIGIPATGFPRRPIFQYAYMVNDLDAAALRWVEIFGAGPFFMERHHVMPDGCFRYRDGAVQADVSYAFAYCGPVQIQLICQYDDKPSIFREMFRPGEEGFHHVAILSHDFAADSAMMEARGMVAAVELAAPSLAAKATADYRVAYYDARSEISCFVELYAAAALPLRMFDHWKQAHDSWDGRTDPIRKSELPSETE